MKSVVSHSHISSLLAIAQLDAEKLNIRKVKVKSKQEWYLLFFDFPNMLFVQLDDEIKREKLKMTNKERGAVEGKDEELRE